LPTEAEWEYASRSGSDKAFCYWDASNIAVSYFELYKTQSKVVASFANNKWGFFDMAGNVAEWCWDLPRTYAGAILDPVGAATGSYRIYRGGDSSATSNDPLRSAARASKDPATRAKTVGFRVVRSLPKSYVCTPQCGPEHPCGPDNCGDTCGSCATDCSNVRPLTFDANGKVKIYGETIESANNHDGFCGTSFGGVGPDSIYSFEVPANTASLSWSVDARFTAVTFLRTKVTTCPGTAGTCGVAIGSVSYPPAGTYYLYVDGKAIRDGGAYTLSVTLTPM
jgi:hypothetical protein